jgi:hypothetical protein
MGSDMINVEVTTGQVIKNGITMCNTFMLIYSLMEGGVGGTIVTVAFTTHHMPTLVSCNTTSWTTMGPPADQYMLF